MTFLSVVILICSAVSLIAVVVGLLSVMTTEYESIDAVFSEDTYDGYNEADLSEVLK